MTDFSTITKEVVDDSCVYDFFLPADFEDMCTHLIENDDHLTYFQQKMLNGLIQVQNEGLDLEAEIGAAYASLYTKPATSGLIRVTVKSKNLVPTPVGEWVSAGTFREVGEIYMEPGKVYDCPMLGDEAVEWCYGIDSSYITVKTLYELIKQGHITITEV